MKDVILVQNITITMKRIYDLIVENGELTYEEIIRKSKASEQSVRFALAGLRKRNLILIIKTNHDIRKTIFYPNRNPMLK